ncbi:hypothetical protein GCM10009663_16750 [Kitasatospora arboriphila]|uniref:Uncharacterized protein n=1 Tax=Kitasatospora arboriphila TaxID=258052 RepID=A0ABN1TFP5_9ACTN
MIPGRWIPGRWIPPLPGRVPRRLRKNAREVGYGRPGGSGHIGYVRCRAHSPDCGDDGRSPIADGFRSLPAGGVAGRGGTDHGVPARRRTLRREGGEGDECQKGGEGGDGAVHGVTPVVVGLVG